jgi:ribosomal protein S15P/S13E
LALTKEAKQEAIEAVRQEREGHGLARGSDRDADRADQRLTEHLRTHKKDHYSRARLLKLVGRRAGS